MENNDDMIDQRIAARLKAMRIARGWSLDDLATRAGVSRASLSRLENAEVSATAIVLGRLASAHGTTLSRLVYMAEDDFAPKIARADQPLFVDPAHGFRRRAVSPPAPRLQGEVIACDIAAHQVIAYETPPRPGTEHHLLMQEGRLTLTVDGVRHDLEPGDCLRYRLDGASRFETGAEGARYVIFIV